MSEFFSKKREHAVLRKIIAIGGGLLRKEETLSIDRFVVKECNKKNKVVLFIPTASMDLPVYISVFTRIYKKLNCHVNILRLVGDSKQTMPQIRTLIATSDIIYIGGGDYDFLLSKWKELGVIPCIKKAYKKGTILAGLSAGCAILYKYVIDTSHNNSLHLKQGIGLIPGIVIPHYKINNSILFGNFLDILGKKKTFITAIGDNCAVFYKNEKRQGTVTTKNGYAFLIRPPYVAPKLLSPYLYKKSKILKKKGFRYDYED